MSYVAHENNVNKQEVFYTKTLKSVQSAHAAG